MTAVEVMALVQELGHGLKVNKDGALVLIGQTQPETPMLVRVLKHHRTELTELLRAQPDIPDFAQSMQCKWVSGFVGRHWFPDKGWPCGAKWWRYEGESDDAWMPIPATDTRGRPWDAVVFRAKLEKFWEESGWQPLGGWKQGECQRGTGE